MKNSFLSVAFYFVTLLTFSQINESRGIPEIMPISPSAFEFLKYGEIPVGKYTGVPKISIPIYTISAKGLEIPINLTYHSNGFRVKEESGWAGLGWSLSAEGSIVQIVNGFDDFGYYKNRDFPNIQAIVEHASNGNAPGGVLNDCNGTRLRMQETDFSGLPNTVDGSGCTNVNGCMNISPSVFGGVVDFEPDVFKFNFLGYSGGFVLDWENELFYCLTDPKIKIEASNYGGVDFRPTDFIIKVPEGHRFLFSLKEESSILLQASQGWFQPGLSAQSSIDLVGKKEKSSRIYKIKQVVTNQNDIIDFEYMLTNPIRSYPSISKTYISYDPYTGYSYPPDLTVPNELTSTTITAQPFSYLSNIYFNNGKIVFDISDRLDIEGGKKLDRIRIQKKTNITGYSTFTTFDFDFDYFVGHTNGTDIVGSLGHYTNWLNKSLQELTYRLKLKSIRQSGKNPYIFSYNNIPLPKKTSLASDYWGYSNGFLTNETMYPNIYRFNSQIGNTSYVDHVNNMKSASNINSKAAILEKITYPTKGYSLFSYELNSFSNYYAPDTIEEEEKKDLETRVEVKIGTEDGNPSTNSLFAEIFDYTSILQGSYLLSTRGCAAVGDYEAYSNTYIQIDYYDDVVTEQVRNTNYSYLYEIIANNLDNHIVHTDYIKMTAEDPEEVLGPDNFSYKIKKSGLVRFKAVGGCGIYNGTVNSSGAWLSLRGNTINLNTYDNSSNRISYGGGLRVKTIENYNADESIQSKKEFIYEGGKLMRPLIFFNKAEYSHQWHSSGSNTTAGTYLGFGEKKTLRTSNNIIPSVFSSGNYVGYSSVSEKISSNTNEMETIGSVKENYLNYQDIGFNPPNDNNEGIGFFNELHIPTRKSTPENGLISERYVYDKENNLLEKTHNIYYFRKSNCFHGGKLIHVKKGQPFTAGGSEYNDIFLLGIYPILNGYSQKHSTTKTKYLKNGEYNITETFGYNSFNQLISIQSEDSNRNSIQKLFRYPLEKSISGDYAANLMLQNNVLTPLLESEIIENSNIISKESFDYRLNLYGSSLMTPSTFVLEKYKYAKAIDNLESKIVYEKYDAHGNLTQVSQNNDSSKTSYLWGYNSQYLVAKIQNATIEEVELLINMSVITDNSTSDVNMRSELNKIRQALPDSMVTTYTYDPLIGVSSMTDPRGNTIYYEYDNFNRLEFIKDSYGNLISENKYKYKN